MMIRLTSIFLISSAILLTPVEALFAETMASLVKATTFQFNPPDDGIPSNTTGGASRNLFGCRRQETATKASNITLLVPSSFMGLTVSAHPEFFLYAEQTLARQLFVNIQDEQGETIYQGYKTLPESTGLISIKVPEEASDLSLESTYRIAVVPVCGDSLQPDDPILIGYVKRVSLPQSVQTAPLTSTFEKVGIYAELGIWYDTLMMLDQILRSEPANSDAVVAWETLLTIGGLESFELTFSAH
ncbi:DUF928 domain-containing protein [Leptothoe sp. EHU-05/26/07-4]